MITTKPKHYTVQIERDNSLIIVNASQHEKDDSIDIGRAFLQVGVKYRDISKLLWKMECKNTEKFKDLYQKVCEAVMYQQAEYNY